MQMRMRCASSFARVADSASAPGQPPAACQLVSDALDTAPFVLLLPGRGPRSSAPRAVGMPEFQPVPQRSGVGARELPRDVLAWPGNTAA